MIERETAFSGYDTRQPRACQGSMVHKSASLVDLSGSVVMKVMLQFEAVIGRWLGSLRDYKPLRTIIKGNFKCS